MLRIDQRIAQKGALFRRAYSRRIFFEQFRVDVVPAKMRVAVRRENLKNAVVQLENRNVKGPAAEVVDRDFRSTLELIEAIGERRRGRLVYDSLDREASQLAGVLRRAALRVVEIGRHRDDR